MCSMGFTCEKPKATFYVWLNCKSSSMEFASKLLSVGVVVTPGVGFGEHGENYVDCVNSAARANRSLQKNEHAFQMTRLQSFAVHLNFVYTLYIERGMLVV